MPPVRSPRAATALLVGVLAVAAVGCRDAPEPRTTAPLDPAAAAVLADAAERLATALDDGDACAALAEADALRGRAEEALADGAAPAEVVTETVRVATVATGDLTCEAEPEPLDDAATEAAEDEDAEEDAGGDADAAPTEAVTTADAPEGGQGADEDEEEEKEGKEGKDDEPAGERGPPPGRGGDDPPGGGHGRGGNR